MPGARTDSTPHPIGGDRIGHRGRILLEVPLDLVNREFRGPGVTRNVSMGGLFVAATVALPAGDRVALLASKVDGGEAAEIEAEIRWARTADEGGGHPAGLGLRFVDPLPCVVRFVRALLRLRQTPAI
jgi:hypothetical protein